MRESVRPCRCWRRGRLRPPRRPPPRPHRRQLTAGEAPIVSGNQHHFTHTRTRIKHGLYYIHINFIYTTQFKKWKWHWNEHTLQVKEIRLVLFFLQIIVRSTLSSPKWPHETIGVREVSMNEKKKTKKQKNISLLHDWLNFKYHVDSYTHPPSISLTTILLWPFSSLSLSLFSIIHDSCVLMLHILKSRSTWFDFVDNR